MRKLVTVFTATILSFALMLGLTACAGSGNSSSGKADDNTNPLTETAAAIESDISAESIPTIDTSSASLGERNALGSATSYLTMMGFSAAGLREQLAFEGYTEDEINYAIENCGADWNEECLQTADSYISMMGFSEPSLRDQLEFEGYLADEIEYAVAHIDVDWNEECAECAQSYLDSMSMSAESLREQLEFEGFTAEQISYGLTAVGY